MVTGSADDATVNEQTGRAALEAGQLVSVADHPELCNSFAPATIRRRPMSIAVSTDGTSSVLARRLRQQLEGLFGPEYGELSELLGQQREELVCQAKNTTRSRKACG